MVSSGADAVEVPARPLGRAARDLLGAPAATAVAVCLGLGVLSVLALSWVPSSDPYAWIDWGQEIASTKIAFGLAGGPSWKPFPVAFTTVFGLFGTTGPGMWLVVVRTSSLLALVAAFRLGRRFAGPVAGILAALALCLVSESVFYFARGASEPVVAALTLWAIDRHLEGSPRLAYVLLFAATLNRPEFSIFLALYALYLWVRIPSARVLAVAGLVLVPVAWLGPPWVISGNPLQASNAALAGKGSPGSALSELRSSSGLMTVSTLVLAAAGLGFAVRRGERVLVWLGAGAIVWALMVAVMTQVAYGLPRYLLPAGTVACLLAGVATVRAAQLAGDRFGSWAQFAAVAAILAATLPWTIPRARSMVQQVRDADQSATVQSQLFLAADRAGGARRVLPCRSSQVAINHSVASMLAWKLKVPLRRIRPLMRGTGFVFIAPHLRDTGQPPTIVHRTARSVRPVAAAGLWRVVEVTRLGASATPHCAPGERT